MVVELDTASSEAEPDDCRNAEYRGKGEDAGQDLISICDQIVIG